MTGPNKSGGDAEEPERYTALYDPDTVYPARMAEAAPRADAHARPGHEDGETSAPIFSDSEKRRAKPALSEAVIKRIADRIEREAKRKNAAK